MEYEFTRNDFLMENYKVLARFLGSYLGPDYEIIIHDLSLLPNTIVEIVNNNLSGRNIGGPITKSALKMIQEKVYEKEDFIVNYKGMSGDKIFRSATMFIKNEHAEVIGLLCINFTDERYINLLENITKSFHPKNWEYTKIIKDKKDVVDNNTAIVEEYYESMDELMKNIFSEVIADIKIPVDYLKAEDRINIVHELSKKGMFKLKGAVPFVAENLQCSQATIYRYLNQ